MDGIVVIDKPEGMTSFDVVAKVRRIVSEKKCGHTGTLDPMASGVLICCLGKATRLVQFLSDGQKRYQATISLGSATDSYDKEGSITDFDRELSIDKKRILEILPQFTGHISQIPPMYSAIHHNGKRLYELAREGITVDRQARDIYIDEIEIKDYDDINEHLKFGDTITLDITCSKGTYIRSLAHDICIKLNTFGHLTKLIRTENAGFGLLDAVNLEDLKENPNLKIHPLILGVRSLLKLSLTEEEVNRIRRGMSITRRDVSASEQKIALVTGDVLIAVADNSDEFLIKPKIVLG